MDFRHGNKNFSEKAKSLPQSPAVVENYPFDPINSSRSSELKLDEEASNTSAFACIENGKSELPPEERQKMLEDYISMQLRLHADLMQQQFLNPTPDPHEVKAEPKVTIFEIEFFWHF